MAVGVVVLAVILAGVWWFGIRDSTDPAADLRGGVWITGIDGLYLTFNEDGSWAASETLDSEVLLDGGTFTFDAGVLTISTDPDHEDCGSYDAATYELDFTDENTIRLTVIDDGCSPRRSDLRLPLVRYSP